MKKAFSVLALALLVGSFSSPVAAQKKEPWFHLEVKENKTEPEYVKVNLPLGMVDVALNAVKDKKFNKGRFKLHSDEIAVADMKKIWNELKKTGNAEFVTVEKKNETVRVAKDGNYVVVKVTENKKPKVDLRVPVGVVDALLASPGDELDIKAALLAMQRQNAGEILTVNDNDKQVRVWID
ncbi:MAG: hypothetical protein L0387_17065 [Acidobacteria bacterium]|nr:hypothetical protein [Acidobacteriota bacterium]MCI0717650.1 hypothetical protein [Acidobacteriota bacterium]